MLLLVPFVVGSSAARTTCRSARRRSTGGVSLACSQNRLVEHTSWRYAAPTRAALSGFSSSSST
ncbi:hypothetical protein K7G98_05670 [Saccharothrix sp. MB29]|nr:hypothetical protein [Saccharothrix sp. MB29]